MKKSDSRIFFVYSIN